MVRIRAISRFASRRRAVFSSEPVAAWKRRLKSSCLVSASFLSSSSSDSERSCLGLKELSLSLHDFGLDGQLVAGEAERVAGERLGDAGQLEHHAAGLDHRDPVLGGTLAGSHAGLGRLLRHRLVREDVDPDLAAALDLARHRDPGSLDLPVREPAGLERLQPELAELDGRLPLRGAGAPAAMVLAELRLLREQHRLASGPLRALVARLVELRRVLVHRLRRRRVRRVDDGRRRGLDLRLDGRLLAPLGRDGALVRARALDARAVAPRTAPTAATARPAAAARAPPPDRSETFAGGRAAAAALARRAETLGGAAASPPGLVLLAEPRVAVGEDALVPLGHDLALVDPDLDADPAERRLRLGQPVVDVGADRVQRHAPLRVGLGPAHLAAAEPAAADHLDAVGAGAHRRGDRALHRAPEADAVLELLRDRLGDELRVELGPLDLVDVDVHVLVGHRVHVTAQRVDLDAGLADDDPRPRRVDVDRDPLLVLPDQDVRDPRVAELPLDVLADLDVLDQRGGEFLLVRVPVGLPVVDDADAEPARMHLLTHYSSLPSVCSVGASSGSAVALGSAAALACGSAAGGASVAGTCAASGRRRLSVRLGASSAAGLADSGSGASSTVMWHVRFLIRLTRPRARARQRFSVGPSSATAQLT